jgi:hypothetical protein
VGLVFELVADESYNPPRGSKVFDFDPKDLHPQPPRTTTVHPEAEKQGRVNLADQMGLEGFHVSSVYCINTGLLG